MSVGFAPLHNKRRLEEEHGNWECQPKRLCGGLVGCGHIEYGAVADCQCPMDTWEIQPQVVPPNGNRGTKVAPDMSAQGNRPAAQCCPRCMAGESGHINHIMGC
ncbi:uncharacterized protein C10orf143 [Engraulis encrasicolus]|uniref:uncharacterized protein C10orf143 n=1 Tax=Engraulis encrasicolus TaxID=184585 RepID=UPI002FD4A151